MLPVQQKDRQVRYFTSWFSGGYALLETPHTIYYMLKNHKKIITHKQQELVWKIICTAVIRAPLLHLLDFLSIAESLNWDWVEEYVSSSGKVKLVSRVIEPVVLCLHWKHLDSTLPELWKEAHCSSISPWMRDKERGVKIRRDFMAVWQRNYYRLQTARLKWGLESPAVAVQTFVYAHTHASSSHPVIIPLHCADIFQPRTFTW